MSCRDDTCPPDGLYGQGGRPQILDAQLRALFGQAHLPAISLSRRRWQAGVPSLQKMHILIFFNSLDLGKKFV